MSAGGRKAGALGLQPSDVNPAGGNRVPDRQRGRDAGGLAGHSAAHRAARGVRDLVARDTGSAIAVEESPGGWHVVLGQVAAALDLARVPDPHIAHSPRRQKSLSFEHLADVLECCFDVAPRESNLTKALDVAELLASILQENNGAAEPQSSLK